MYLVDLSKDDDYHTQLNNTVWPMEACGPTSGINCLYAAGIDFDKPVGIAADDHLMSILRSDEGYKVMARLAPWAAGAYHPNEVHICLEWAINKMVGRKVDKFTEHGTLQSVIWNLAHGRPLIMSGPFTPGGHMVAVVGFLSAQHEDEVEILERVMLKTVIYIKVDDSYGDWHSNYRDHKGNGIKFVMDKFDSLTNVPDKDGNKHMHIINPDGWA